MNSRRVRDHGVGDQFNQFTQDLGAGDGPFCINFGDSIYFIATRHTHDESSDTYKLIEKVVTEIHPNIVLVEGVGSARGINPNLTGWAGEMHHAAVCARRAGVDFMGVEPSDDSTNNKLCNKYKKCDVLGMYFMRDYRYAVMTAKETKEQFLERFYKIMPQIGIKCRAWNHKTWFKRAFDKTFRWGCFLEYGVPFSLKDAPVTRRIAADTSKLRDIFAVDLISDLVRENKKVVIVMGKNHAYAQFEAIRSVFENYSVILP